MEGKNLFELYPKEQAQAYWDDDLEVIKSRKPKLNIEEPWETEEGTRWVNTNKIPYFAENGEIEGIIGFSTDTTEHKKEELNLQESEENFRAVTENANDGILIISGKGEFIYVNKRMSEITGYSIEELLKFKIKDLTHPMKIIGAVKRNLPDEFFKGNSISHDHIMRNPSEVILSECFVDRAHE